MRIGLGTDIHRLVAGRPLIIGGVRIQSDVGSEGHSDGDVLMHAAADAVLGAIAAGDIGMHFPNNEERWRGVESSQFLAHAAGLAKEKGFVVGNLDAVVHLETPKLRPYIDAMRTNLAAALEADISQVSVKAKTGERVGAVGQRLAVSAQAVVLLLPK